MKTKENQDRQSTAAPRQERRARPEDSAPGKKKRPASDAAVSNPAPARSRPAQAPGKGQNPDARSRQKPAGDARNVPTQSRQRSAPAPQKEQPEVQRQQPAKRQPDSRPARSQSAAQQQPRRTAASELKGVSVTPPQGTGPRKSAPRSSGSSVPSRRSTTGTVRKQEKKNPVQNLLSSVVNRRRMDPEEKARLRRKQEQAREKRKAALGNAPVVIYTQPQSFNRDRLILELISIMAVVAALILGMSVFFKVKTITVAGAETYSSWSVQEASGIKEGDNLLTFSKTRARAKILANMAYVDSVRIGIKLPDTVNIEITELDVVYAVQASDNTWWLMDASGRIVDRSSASAAKAHTQVLGVRLETPEIGQTATAAQPQQETTAPTQTDDDAQQDSVSVLPNIPVITASQQLDDALQILRTLEAKGIIGGIASVDVTDISDLQMWYGQNCQIKLGDHSRLDYKIASMKAAIAQMGQFQSGTLDVSFTTWPNEVWYNPF